MWLVVSTVMSNREMKNWALVGMCVGVFVLICAVFSTINQRNRLIDMLEVSIYDSTRAISLIRDYQDMMEECTALLDECIQGRINQ